MASLLVVLIIIGCVAYQYLKGTLVKSFVMLMTAICASIAAFSYFELLAKVFIGRDLLALWAQPLSFVLLFVLAFAILQTLTGWLARRPIDLGVLPERIGRVVCGILLGLILSGLLLTALAMAPLSNKHPYQRFDRTKPNPERPNKALFNVDGFITGWFNVISSGSFSGKRSFAVLHPNFLDQVFLNRHEIAEEISIFTQSAAIKVPNKEAVWPAPQRLTDSKGKPVPAKSGRKLTIVRVGINKSALRDAGRFTLSQLRLVCKQKSDAKKPLAGKGKTIFPLGYLKTANQLQIKQLNDQIRLESVNFEDRVRWVDFAFYVPDDSVPVLVEFKQNNIAQLPRPVTVEQAPPAAPFIQRSDCATNITELEPVSSAKLYGTELATGYRFLTGLTLEVNDPNQWESAQTANSIRPAQFEDGQFNYVRAELRIEKPAGEEAEEAGEEAEASGADESERRRSRFDRTSSEESRGIRGMFKPLDGYELISLKCNKPSAGAATKGEQLPVLVEVSGLTHHAVGVIASGKVGDQTIYEGDYCAVAAEDTTDGLTIAEDETVAQPFPDIVWLTEQAESISEFYVLYLVKPAGDAIIVSVRPGDSQVGAGFEGYEGFSLK